MSYIHNCLFCDNKAIYKSTENNIFLCLSHMKIIEPSTTKKFLTRDEWPVNTIGSIVAKIMNENNIKFVEENKDIINDQIKIITEEIINTAKKI